MTIQFDRHIAATSREQPAFGESGTAHLGAKLVGETNQLSQAEFLKKRQSGVPEGEPPASLLMTTPFHGQSGESLITPVDFRPPGTARDLESVAQQHAGEKLWKRSKYARETANGLYGCAASMSLVLEDGGYKYADSPTVGGLVSQLERHGWTKVPVAQAQPNDVMVAYNKGTGWQNGGGNAHLGVVGSDGNVWNNSKRVSETWQSEPPDVAFGQYDSRFVLRPPAK